VEGTVQVFAQTDHSPEVQQSVWDDEDMNGYQLLNEVGSGGTLSSLFTILSLFTEDVQMSWQDDDPDLSTDDMAQFDEGGPLPPRNQTRRASSDVSQFRFEPGSPDPTARRCSVSSTASTVHARDLRTPSRGDSVSPSQDGSTPSMPIPHLHHRPIRRLTQARRGVVARATVDTTLAVIPAEAFRRLTKKFPKATGHIVQGNSDLSGFFQVFTDSYTVILTRFTRVTFNAAHKYLGLTSEVLRTEKAINDIACHPLPTSFYEGGGLQYLRHRFDGSTTSDSDSDYFSTSPSLSNLSPLPTSKDTSTSLGHIANKPNPGRGSKEWNQSGSSRSSHHMVQAGDLLIPRGLSNDASRPVTRTFSVLNTPRVSYFDKIDNGRSPNQRRGTSRWPADDFDLREEVMSCIAKSIGLLQPPLSGSDSPPSPPSELRRASTSAFGSLSLLDLGDDMSSVTGKSSIHSSGNYLRGLDNEVEILFYAAGTTLAKAGESNTGIVLLSFVTYRSIDVI
jgi:lysophospholipid hydrolase